MGLEEQCVFAIAEGGATGMPFVELLRENHGAWRDRKWSFAKG